MVRSTQANRDGRARKKKQFMQSAKTAAFLFLPVVAVAKMLQREICFVKKNGRPCNAKDTLAERLRRRPAKPMGSPRAGSNPAGVDFEFPAEPTNVFIVYW